MLISSTVEEVRKMYEDQMLLARRKIAAQESEIARLRGAVERVRQAITDKGINRGWHEEVMARHRKEWPTLWSVLDEILESARSGGFDGL